MKIPVTCPACGSRFQVEERYAGRRGRCPKADCRAELQVPSLAGSFPTASHPDQPAGQASAPPIPPVPAAKAARRSSPPVAASLPELPSSPGRSRSSSSGAARRAGGLPSLGSRRQSKGTTKTNSSRSLAISGGIATLVMIVAGLSALQFRTGSGGAVGDSSSAAAASPAGSGANAVPVLAVSQATPVPEAVFAHRLQGVLTKSCGECHSGDAAEGGWNLAAYSDDQSVHKDRKRWERVLELISGGIMPPPEAPALESGDKQQLIAGLEYLLFEQPCQGPPDPGRVTIRRLNRVEYNNTIRDLIGLDLRPADQFPSDDVGYGFDNIGDVLSLPPLLMEKYLDAAELVSRKAILAIDRAHPAEMRFSWNNVAKSGAAHRMGDEDSESTILVSNGGITAAFDISVPGQYELVVNASANQAGDEPARLEFVVDGKNQHTVDVPNPIDQPQQYRMMAELSGGPHRFTPTFANDYWDGRDQNNIKDRNLAVHWFKVVGPLQVTADQYPPSHRQLVANTPAEGRTVADAARDNLRPFVRRAFRRAVSDSELDPYVRLVERAVQDGESFEFGMQIAVEAVLVSPPFLFRLETDERPDDPAFRRSVTDYELASRLSYFLWSSMPDDQLLDAAAAGRLNHDDELQAQVRRMLADPKSNALVENFAEQWLQLRILDDVTPDPEKFPGFTEQLRADLKQETRRFLQVLVREDRSVYDLLEGDYTFVNQRLAQHYGFPGQFNDEFQRVSLAGTGRTGVLTQGSVLTITSNPNRTSPVKRGKWIMEVVLNTPPPPPPPNVPELEQSKAAGSQKTLREQLEIHRENAACAACHRQMDQLGFGLENFDFVGRYREQDEGHPIDSSGNLPSGQSFTGAAGLAGVLSKDFRTKFVASMTERMLTYSLGRGLEFYDRCTVDRLTRQIEREGARFSTMVLAIVQSEPFRQRRGDGRL